MCWPGGWQSDLTKDMNRITAVTGISLLAIHLATVSPAGTPPPLPAPAPPDECIMDEAGFLSGRLYGSLEATLDWRPPALRCDGMPRPDNDGIRLFFTHPISDEAELSLVLGIHADRAQLTAGEWPVTVTLIDERSSRFYSSGEQARCWTRIREAQPLPAAAGGGIRVAGQLWCVGALPSLNDLASVTLGDIDYSGRIKDDVD